jgi:signal transduction histidine kinase
MSWHYACTPYVWPSLFTFIFLSALSGYAWRRRRTSGALPFAIGSLLAALWSVGSAMESAAQDLPGKVLWFEFQNIWQLPAATAVTCFILEYAWPGRFTTPRNLILLSIVPVLNTVLILSNGLHHLVSRGYSLNGSLLAEPGPAAWSLSAYGYALGIVNLATLVWLFVRSAEHRWPAAIMALGQTVARVVYPLHVLHIVRTELPLDILGIGFLFLMYAVVLFGFHIFDPIPLARRMAIDQLHAGMLVLNGAGQVVSLNPCAEHLLGIPAGRAVGQPIAALLPAQVGLDLGSSDMRLLEFSRAGPPGTRDFTLEVSRLRDWRGLDVGRLLLLRDVTEPKRARELQKQQHLLLAVLHERERLARELHDSIGQALGYAGFEVEVIAQLWRDGHTAAATAQLDRLGAIMREAHADLRERILDLRSGCAAGKPLFAWLQQYLDGFSANYDIQAGLFIAPGLEEESFSAEAQLQVFRIAQEALSNARKHAHARRVQVRLETRPTGLRMTVQDDGCGFSVDAAEQASGQHFGLQFMRERAAQLGASLTIHSAPGKGTRILLDVPREEPIHARPAG